MLGEMPRRIALALAAVSAFAAAPAWALFDDDEARRQIAELRKNANERLETQSRAQLDLANQIEAMKAEMAKLRGQVETLTYELDATKKRQQDFYIDLDERVRKLEPNTATAAGPAPGAKPAGDAAAAAWPDSCRPRKPSRSRLKKPAPMKRHSTSSRPASTRNRQRLSMAS